MLPGFTGLRLQLWDAGLLQCIGAVESDAAVWALLRTFVLARYPPPCVQDFGALGFRVLRLGFRVCGSGGYIEI